MKYCNKCIMPNTRPGVELNSDGVCGPCVTHDNRPAIDWSAKLRKFEAIVESAKAHPSPYDCLIPVSGGKDSTWQVVKCLEYGLNPLCITQKVPLRTELGQRNLDNLVKRLPGGLDGNLGEEGINLSGGEIQRIGLCRALIYDPEVLFLDEATSSLDTETESQILDELEIFKDKTIISIAHRINTIKNCDYIFEISEGRVANSGTIKELDLKN